MSSRERLNFTVSTNPEQKATILYANFNHASPKGLKGISEKLLTNTEFLIYVIDSKDAPPSIIDPELIRFNTLPLAVQEEQVERLSIRLLKAHLVKVVREDKNNSFSRSEKKPSAFPSLKPTKRGPLPPPKNTSPVLPNSVKEFIANTPSLSGIDGITSTKAKKNPFEEFINNEMRASLDS